MSPEPVADFPLARLTTVGTGGAAEFFARAGTSASSTSCWPGRRTLAAGVAVVGSGSNLLVADDGVPGLVLKLDRELARIEPRGARIRCGGGARLPAVAARAADRADRDRVRRQHPGHGRRRRADERQRLRRRAGRGA